MGSASKREKAGAELTRELWVWASWLVLCVISYPALVVLRAAPWAGLVGCLALGSFLLVIAGVGSAGRPERLADSRAGAAAAAAAAALVWLTASAADRAAGWTAGLCALGVGMGMLFTWHFLPWLVRDAATPESLPAAGLQLMPRLRRTHRVPRGALSFALLLGFLCLGLGAAWARGERWIPSPTGWLVALLLFTFGLMFVERMNFFQRSAKDGNLLLAGGAHLGWVAAALLSLAVAAGLAALAPWRPAPERTAEARLGSAALPAAPAGGSAAERLLRAADRAGATLQQFGALARRVPRGLLSLWLLLLLLLAAAILLWAFPRSRAARWLLWLMAWTAAKLARAWRRLVTFARRWFSRRGEVEAAPEEPAAEEPADPLFDFLEDPEALAALAPREVAIRTYHLLLNFAEMLGHGRAVGQTPFEYARSLLEAAPQQREAVHALTWAYAGAMYGGESAELPAIAEVREAWQRVSRALQAGIAEEELALRRRAYLVARGAGRRG